MQKFTNTFFAILLVSSAHAAAQVPPPEPGRVSEDSSVADRSNETAKEQSAISSSKSGQSLQPVRNYVKSVIRKLNRSASGQAEADRNAEIDIDSVANALVTMGYTVADLRSSEGSDSDLVNAAQNIVLGRPTLRDMLTVSPSVFTGEIVSVQFDNSLKDGFGSTLNMKIVSSIKGAPPIGTIVKIRQRSGTGADEYLNSNDFLPGATGTYLMFVSQNAYSVRSKKDDQQFFSRVLLPYAVSGDSLLPTGMGQEPGNITEIM